MSRIDQIAVTPTVARQSQKQEFGEVLKTSLQQGVNAVGVVSGAVLGSIPGAGVVSAAVSAVTNFAGQGARSASAASSGIINVGGGATAGLGSGGIAAPAVAGDMAGMMGEMRAEANRSMAMQMAMQQESREYNTISNVLKVRHDSAKAAINNIR
ncbi:MAG: hypothetical protein JNJ54_12610 [Myxococcaceae bacterium]|nr:hypothetical protein [Myxococcaceae bacterium]